MAAHLSLPFGTILRLTNPTNKKVAIVIILDRGPFIPGRQLDVSESVSKTLSFRERGVTELDVEVLKTYDVQGSHPTTSQLLSLLAGLRKSEDGESGKIGRNGPK